MTSGQQNPTGEAKSSPEQEGLCVCVVAEVRRLGHSASLFLRGEEVVLRAAWPKCAMFSCACVVIVGSTV